MTTCTPSVQQPYMQDPVFLQISRLNFTTALDDIFANLQGDWEQVAHNLTQMLSRELSEKKQPNANSKNIQEPYENDKDLFATVAETVAKGVNLFYRLGIVSETENTISNRSRQPQQHSNDDFLQLMQSLYNMAKLTDQEYEQQLRQWAELRLLTTDDVTWLLAMSINGTDLIGLPQTERGKGFGNFLKSKINRNLGTVDNEKTARLLLKTYMALVAFRTLEKLENRCPSNIDDGLWGFMFKPSARKVLEQALAIKDARLENKERDKAKTFIKYILKVLGKQMGAKNLAELDVNGLYGLTDLHNKLIKDLLLGQSNTLNDSTNETFYAGGGVVGDVDAFNKNTSPSQRSPKHNIRNEPWRIDIDTAIQTTNNAAHQNPPLSPPDFAKILKEGQSPLDTERYYHEGGAFVPTSIKPPKPQSAKSDDDDTHAQPDTSDQHVIIRRRPPKTQIQNHASLPEGVLGALDYAMSFIRPRFGSMHIVPKGLAPLESAALAEIDSIGDVYALELLSNALHILLQNEVPQDAKHRVGAYAQFLDVIKYMKDNPKFGDVRNKDSLAHRLLTQVVSLHAKGQLTPGQASVLIDYITALEQGRPPEPYRPQDYQNDNNSTESALVSDIIFSQNPKLLDTLNMEQLLRKRGVYISSIDIGLSEVSPTSTILKLALMQEFHPDSPNALRALSTSPHYTLDSFQGQEQQKIKKTVASRLRPVLSNNFAQLAAPFLAQYGIDIFAPSSTSNPAPYLLNRRMYDKILEYIQGCNKKCLENNGEPKTIHLNNILPKLQQIEHALHTLERMPARSNDDENTRKKKRERLLEQRDDLLAGVFAWFMLSAYFGNDIDEDNLDKIAKTGHAGSRTPRGKILIDAMKTGYIPTKLLNKSVRNKLAKAGINTNADVIELPYTWKQFIDKLTVE